MSGCLQVLQSVPDVETHLVMSNAARQTLTLETDITLRDVQAMADVVHDARDIAASISSGSFKTAGMVILPCSIKTLSGIVNSYTDGLLTRAADVVLKESRRLVLCVRETPLHLGHLRLMTQAAELGAIIMPPVPAFYHRPRRWKISSIRPLTASSISLILSCRKTCLFDGRAATEFSPPCTHLFLAFH